MPSLFGSPPPAASYAQLVTGDSANFTASLGSWVATGGTMTRDTTWKDPAAVASLKHVTTAAGQRVDLPIAGTFKAGVEYVCFVALSLEETGLTLASNRTQFGLIGTDVADTGTQVVSQTAPIRTFPWAGATDRHVVIGLRWVPTANRTGVSIRVERPSADGGNTETWHVGFVRVWRNPTVGGPALLTSPFDPWDTFVPSQDFVSSASISPFSKAGYYVGYDGLGISGPTAGVDVGSTYGVYVYGEGNAGAGDLSQTGINIEAGPDYPGFYISEYDANTVQLYADLSTGYMLQLRHRGSGKGWAVSEDGAINRRIESYFEHRVTVAGTLTTGTDKGGVGQVIHLPYKARIDEVRAIVGTRPEGANLLVDVNAAGTTIFTTQANRPAVGVNIKNIAGASDSTDAISYVTTSVTLKAGRLYLMAVENSHASAAAVVSDITALDVVFISRSTTTFNAGLNRVSIWSFVPTADFTGTLTINYAGTQTGIVWALDEVTGVDTTTAHGIVQQAVGTGTSTTPLATLAAFAAAANGAYAAHGQAAAAATTPGTGFTELSDATAATPAQAMETAYSQASDTTADATITSAAWGSCAVELTAALSANSRTPDGGTTIAKDAPITVDIDQIGSGTAGADLTVLIRGSAIW